jgi:hypothetical protein
MYCKLLEPTARLELLCNNCVFAVAGELTMTIMCVRWRLKPTLLRNVTSVENRMLLCLVQSPINHNQQQTGCLCPIASSRSPPPPLRYHICANCKHEHDVDKTMACRRPSFIRDVLHQHPSQLHCASFVSLSPPAPLAHHHHDCGDFDVDTNEGMNIWQCCFVACERICTRPFSGHKVTCCAPRWQGNLCG